MISFLYFFLSSSLAAAPANYSPVQQLAKKLQLVNIAPHHKGELVDSSTYVGSVSHGEFHSDITLVAMQQQDKQWQKKWSYTFSRPVDVHSPEEGTTLLPCNAMQERDGFTRPKIYLKVDDFDKDGKPELLVRTITCHIFRAIGPKTQRHMYLFNTTEKGLEPSVEILLEEHASWHTISKAKFKDENGDGHPDIYLSTTTDGGETKETSQKVLLYDPKLDRYQ